MKKYCVEITYTNTQSWDLDIEADSKEQAIEQALEKAPYLNWSDGEADFTASIYKEY